MKMNVYKDADRTILLYLALPFFCCVQIAHDTLLQYGSTDLQALLQITGEGGAWSNPVLTSLLTGQLTNPEEG